MTKRAPRRLSDDPTTSSGLRVALRASDDELPNAEELTRLRAALKSQVGELVRQVEVAREAGVHRVVEPAPPAQRTSWQRTARTRLVWGLGLLLAGAAAAHLLFQ